MSKVTVFISYSCCVEAKTSIVDELAQHCPPRHIRLLRTWQKGAFQQRTHPIIADDCDLQDAAYRIGVVDYWIAEHVRVR